MPAADAPSVAWPATAPEWSLPVSAALQQVDGLMHDSKRIYESLWRMLAAQPNLPLLSNSQLEDVARGVQAAALEIASGVVSHIVLGFEQVAFFLALLSGAAQPVHRQLVAAAVRTALQQPVV